MKKKVMDKPLVQKRAKWASTLKGISVINDGAALAAYSTQRATGQVRTMKASEFKAKCLQVMDEVAASGEPVVITKNGVPVSRLIPERQKPKRIFGAMKGSVLWMGDLDEPTGEVWEAES